jgi:hypothetical protein
MVKTGVAASLPISYIFFVDVLGLRFILQRNCKILIDSSITLSF